VRRRITGKRRQFEVRGVGLGGGGAEGKAGGFPVFLSHFGECFVCECWWLAGQCGRDERGWLRGGWQLVICCALLYCPLLIFRRKWLRDREQRRLLRDDGRGLFLRSGEGVAWIFLDDDLDGRRRWWNEILHRFDDRFGVGDLAGAAGGCDVDADRIEDIGCTVTGADDFGGIEDCIEAAGVGGRELKSVEESLGALDVDEVTGEGVDDLGESELDGETVLQRGQRDDVAAFHQTLAADHTTAVEAVSLVEPVVEVAEDGGFECDRFALMAIRLDVTTECDLHEGS